MKKHDTRVHRIANVTRRGFLASMAAGAVGTAFRPLESFALRVDGPPVPIPPDRFSRMFNLPAFADATPRTQAALVELGAPGGLMDAMDPLHEGPIRLITIPELSPHNRDNAAGTAGLTFLGQFLDHDMTFDPASKLGEPTQPERAVNMRTPAFDLDCVYGGGFVLSPELYDPADPAKFRVEHGGLFEDLPRGLDGRATIADPRNDENLMIAGLQVAFLRFHNRVVDMLRDNGDDRVLVAARRPTGRAVTLERDKAERTSAVFEEARRLVTWHYHWIILNEFLPRIIGASLVNEILSRGRRFYNPRPGEQTIPVEFQAAAYRFGHSLVRPSYRANLAGDDGHPFFGFIFDPAGEGQLDPVDLRGGARCPRRFIGWQTFFDFGGEYSASVRPPKSIDTKISTPLFHLPLGAIASGDQPTALPQRNLLRHLTWSLPSGQAIAQAMRMPMLGRRELSELADFGMGFETDTPLWYYVLKEAELSGGTRLAGVGARIVGEVFVGLLTLDSNSYLWRNRSWTPTLPSRTRGTFEMVDLLTFAGVDPASRGQ